MPAFTSPGPDADVSAEQLDVLTRLFRVLSDPVRLRILLLLVQGERNVTSLCAATGLAQPTVSHHLALLRTASLARGRRDGKSIIYSASPRIGLEGSGSLCFQADERPVPHVRVRATRPTTPADCGSAALDFAAAR